MGALEAMLGVRDEALRTKQEKVPTAEPVSSSSSVKSSAYFGRCIVEIEEPDERYSTLFSKSNCIVFALIHIVIGTL